MNEIGAGPGNVVISLEGVGKNFAAFEAVKNVTLDIRRGEFVSLLGPSGCGKSTILRMIAGFEQPSRGRLIIDGADVQDVPPNLRPVNMVFQSYALFPHLTVAENVAFGLRRRLPVRRALSAAEIKREVDKYLALVGLEGYGNRHPKQLSGGQQQRTALARALVKQPKVLLLDEPLGALDLKLRKRMQFELKHLQRELGITFVFVTHDQDEAMSLSDSVAVMNEGAVIQYGPTKEVYDQPRTAFVAGFLGEANILRGKVAAVGDAVAVDVGDQRISVSPGAEAASPGAAVSVALRPEQLWLGEPAPGAGLRGTIVDKVFLGNSFVLQVAVPGAATIMVRGADREVFEAIERNQAVSVCWKPASARIVAA